MRSQKPPIPHQTLVDKAIGIFAPRVALRRMQARGILALAGGYSGAKYNRPGLAAWNPTPSDAEGDINGDLPVLRARARDLVRNAPLASGAINTMVTNVVGTGLSVQPAPDAEYLGITEQQADEWSRNALREFRGWAETTACDVTRTQNFFGLQSLTFRSALESGDVLALLPMVERTGSPYRISLQIVFATRTEKRIPPRWPKASSRTVTARRWPTTFVVSTRDRFTTEKRASGIG